MSRQGGANATTPRVELPPFKFNPPSFDTILQEACRSHPGEAAVYGRCRNLPKKEWCQGLHAAADRLEAAAFEEHLRSIGVVWVNSWSGGTSVLVVLRHGAREGVGSYNPRNGSWARLAAMQVAYERLAGRR